MPLNQIFEKQKLENYFFNQLYLLVSANAFLKCIETELVSRNVVFEP